MGIDIMYKVSKFDVIQQIIIHNKEFDFAYKI